MGRAMAEPWDITDKMLVYLIERAAALAAHADNPRADAELERVVNLIEAYARRSAGLTARRWAGRVELCIRRLTPTPVSGDSPELYDKRGFGPPSLGL